MKRLLLFLFCIVATAALSADEQADRTEIVRRGKEMIASTFKGEMHAVIGFMNPAVVKVLGGEENLKKAISGVAAQMKEIGLEFVSMEVLPPEKFYAHGGRTFAVVQTKTVMQIPGQTRLRESSSMIAIRDSADGPWTFLRVNEALYKDRSILKRILPDFPDEIVLEPPAKMEPESLAK